MRQQLPIMRLAALVVALTGLSCQSPRINERLVKQPLQSRVVAEAVRPLGAESAEASFERLRYEVETSGVATHAGLLELGALAHEIGERKATREPACALPWFRDAAAYSVFALRASTPQGSASPFEASAIAQHNRSVEALLRCAGASPKCADPAFREQLAVMGIQPRAVAAEGVPTPWEELWIARDFRVRHLEPVQCCGLGVPLIAVSYYPNRSALPAKFLPERLRLPASAVLVPNGPLRGGAWRAQPATLALHDPRFESTVALGATGCRCPLAIDLTTPLGHQFINAPMTELAWGGLLRPDSYGDVAGIYMYGPYQPGKVPILFVHGLWSTPDAWLKMTNGLYADPLIRSRYQFWYAYYPTGAPLMASAVRIRRALGELREAIDPAHSDAQLDQMVVVGHSLGGVLGKQLIQSSGQALEKSLLTRPFDQVAMSPESRRILSEILYFEPVPSIRRAVMIAAPHRGSNTANQLIGRLSSSLVQRPGALVSIHAEVLALNGPEVLQPFYRSRPPSSIDNLQWDSPILKTLSELPIAPSVPYHSIVANLFPNQPSRLWTDGVVRFESAHLDGAQSEIMVRHSHFVNDTPEATAEVQRILRLHLSSVASGTESHVSYSK